MLDADEILNGDEGFRKIERTERKALRQKQSDANGNIT
jgi:hypothetical protein